MSENITSSNDITGSEQKKTNPFKKNTAKKVAWEPHFQVSKQDPSCIYFEEGDQTHFYNLRNISLCVNSWPDVLKFTLSGRTHKISGRASECLLAALKDWHERKDK